MDDLLGTPPRFATVEPVPNIYNGEVVHLKSVLTAEECQAIIELAEAKGMVPAALYTDAAGVDHFSDVRKSKRCFFDSLPFVTALWERVKHAVPVRWGSMYVLADQPLNERLRILRYDPGDEFLPHRDGRFMAADGSISKITLLLYMNEDHEGGYTEFKTLDDTWLPVVPRVGDVVLMDQDVSHRVPPLLSGVKYSLRTEVMYSLKE